MCVGRFRNEVVLLKFPQLLFQRFTGIMSRCKTANRRDIQNQPLCDQQPVTPASGRRRPQLHRAPIQGYLRQL
jgi:hypothetical protein